LITIRDKTTDGTRVEWDIGNPTSGVGFQRILGFEWAIFDVEAHSGTTQRVGVSLVEWEVTRFSYKMC
jgi:hypothetical protein